MFYKRWHLAANQFDKSHAAEDAEEGPGDDDNVAQRSRRSVPIAQEMRYGIRETRKRGLGQELVQSPVDIDVPLKRGWHRRPREPLSIKGLAAKLVKKNLI